MRIYVNPLKEVEENVIFTRVEALKNWSVTHKWVQTHYLENSAVSAAVLTLSGSYRDMLP